MRFDVHRVLRDSGNSFDVTRDTRKSRVQLLQNFSNKTIVFLQMNIRWKSRGKFFIFCYFGYVIRNERFFIDGHSEIFYFPLLHIITQFDTERKYFVRKQNSYKYKKQSISCKLEADRYSLFLTTNSTGLFTFTVILPGNKEKKRKHERSISRASPTRTKPSLSLPYLSGIRLSTKLQVRGH